MKKTILVLMLTCLLTFAGIAGAAMMGGTGSNSGSMMGGGTGTTATMMGGGMGMSNSGGFGMMNGMAGAPVVGNDGTAYIVGLTPTAAAGTTPSSNVFQSTISAVTPAGSLQTITLKGIVSRPIIQGNVLIATASLPDFANYSVAGNLGTSSPSGQSVAYVVELPMTSSSVPIAVTMDGVFASMPVISGNYAYIVTSDFGNGMMNGNNTFNMMYGNYNFNSAGTAHSYMFIVDLSGNLVNKVILQ